MGQDPGTPELRYKFIFYFFNIGGIQTPVANVIKLFTVVIYNFS
jgi:hypothetical protein